MTLNKVVDDRIMEKFSNNYSKIVQYLSSPKTIAIRLRFFFGSKTYKKLNMMADMREKLLSPIIRNSYDDFDDSDMICSVVDQLISLMNNSPIK